MKKKYIVPSMMVVRVKTVTMIAASGFGTNVGMSNAGYTESNEITEGASRSFSIWDDDEN